LRRAGRECIDHLLANEAAARAGDLEGVHQMRVAVRRLRAILSALAPLLPMESRRCAANELRWLADALGEARNLDVLTSDILEPARASLPPTNGLECLAEVIDRHSQYAHAEAEAAINSSRFSDSVRELMNWFDKSGWRGPETDAPLCRPIGELAPMVLERRYRSVKKYSRQFGEQSEKQRHQLRIVLKKMRYAAELLSELYNPAVSKRFLQRIKRLQDDLGYRNDVHVARDTIDNLTNAKPRDPDLVKAGERVVAWHQQRLADDEAKLRQHLRQFLATEPFWSYRRNLRPTEPVHSGRHGRRPATEPHT